MSSGGLVLGVDTFVALLAAALLLSIFAERAGVPGAVLLVAAGMLAGGCWHVRPPFQFSEALLFIFLPPLLFEAAWNVSLEVLRQTWRQIVLLAFPGTLVVAFSIAGGISALGSLPFATALLYGAMVAATDPVAVIAVFRKFPVPERLKTIVEAESICNDGVALVLYTTALTMATGGTVNVPAAAGHGMLEVAGGIAIGSAFAYAAWWLLQATAAPEFEVTLTVALAYITYLAADHLGLSGIFACASAGVLLRALQRRNGHVITNLDAVDHFWNATAFIANAVVFIGTGLLIGFPRVTHEPALILPAIAIVFISRAVLVAAVFRDRRSRLTAFLAGMRGALPLALAFALPKSVDHRAQILDAVFATVFATLVLQGLPLQPVISRLYPSNRDRHRITLEA